MDKAAIAAMVLKLMRKKAVPYAKAQLARDASNLYSLKEEWWLPAFRKGLPSGEYRGEVVNVCSDGQTVLVWYNPFESTPKHPVCDGASRFPDVFLGIDLRPAAIAHDAWYREMEAIARAFGVPLKTVRKFGDRIFASVNLAENAGKPFVSTVSTLTYWGVRICGGIYHRRHISAALALAALALGGCAGCVGTEFADGGDGYESPQWEQVGGGE